ncbi:MAG: hypothetical protein AAF790_01425 [Planctomycetota bacterium]
MIWFVAITATLNLCVGYTLGVMIGELPTLPALPARGRRRPVDPPDVDIDLDAPAPPDDDTQQAATSHDAPPPPAEQDAGQPTAQPSHAEVMQGLAAFQAQLAKMGSEMQDAADDERAFGECSGRLQQANHDYLEQAQHTIEGLSSDPTNADAVACRDAIEENAKVVLETSDEIDAILADGPPDAAAREELIAKTESLTESVANAERKVEAAGPEPKREDAPQATAADEASAEDTTGSEEDPAAGGAPPEPGAGAGGSIDPASHLATLGVLQQAIDDEIASSPEAIIAAVRRDPLEADGAGADVESRLLAALTDIADELLGETQLFSPQGDDRLLMLLRGDNLDEASQRVEQLRQAVEKTTFTAGDDALQATVTCVLAEAGDGADRDELLELAEEALAEADRLGGNRSYHHDGRFPAPIPAEDLNCPARSRSI